MNRVGSGGRGPRIRSGKRFSLSVALVLAMAAFACGGGGGGGGGGQAPPPQDPAQQLSQLNQELRSELAQQIVQLEQEEGLSLDEESFTAYGDGDLLAMMVPAQSVQSLSQAGNQNRLFLGTFFFSPASGERVGLLSRNGPEPRDVQISSPVWMEVNLLTDQGLVELNPLRGQPTDSQTGQPVTEPFTVPTEIVPVSGPGKKDDQVVSCLTDEGCDPVGINKIEAEKAVNAFVEAVLPGDSQPSVVKFKAGIELSSVAEGGGPGDDPTANTLKTQHDASIHAIRNFRRVDEAGFDNPFPDPDLDNMILYSGKNLFLVATPFGGNINLGERRGADLGLLYIAPSGSSQQFPAGLKGLEGDVYIVHSEFSEDGQQAWGYLVDKNGRQVSPSQPASLLELVDTTAGLSGKGPAQGGGPIPPALGGPFLTPSLKLCFTIKLFGRPTRICLDFLPPPQLPCLDPPSDLLAWWKMDDAAGSSSILDVFGTSNATPKKVGSTGSLTLGSAANIDPVPGQVGNALRFVGNPSNHGYGEVSTGPVMNLGATPFTIDAWAKIPASTPGLSPTSHHTLVGKLDSTTNQGFWLVLLRIGPIGSLIFQYNSGGGLSSAASTPFFLDAGWHFYAAVVQNNQVSFYRDGSLVSSSTISPGSLVTSTPLKLGFEPAVGASVSNHITVSLDEVEIFGRDLTDSEIQQIYRHSVGRLSVGKCEPEPGQNEGTLCFRKFNDLNGNGVWDGGEPALFGFTFEIYDSSGNLVTTFTTSQQDSCLKLPAGTYTVKEVGPSGWTPTTPDPATVTINAGQATTLIVGNTQQPKEGTLCVLKFEDTDGDGQQDPGENPLAGWQFEVYDSAGNLVTTITTTDQDVTCITLPEGTYTIKEVSQAGWVSTTPDTQTVNLSAGSSTTVAFGNQQEQPREGTLCVLKFEDLDGNGQQDAGEGLLSGWQFEVYDSNGNLVTTITTGGQDFDCITLPAGNYTVKEVPQAGWVPTTPQQQNVTINAGSTSQVKFGNQQEQVQAGVLCVIKFEDADGDGQQGANEGLLGGWKFDVFDSGGNLVTTLTSSAQDATCTELPPGDYTVQEQVQQGWVVTTPNPQTVTVSSGSTTTVTFGNQQEQVPTGVLCVVKFEDQDGDGQQGANEGLLGGWKFDVFDSAGNLVTTITSSDQDASCTEVPVGDYTVQEQVQQGWVVTTPNPQTVTVNAGAVTTVTFGNQQEQPQGSAQICVIKFNDADGDGQRGANDGLMAGWAFDIFDSGGNKVGTLISSKQGPVCQEVSAPGTYTVEEQVQQGWTPTTPNPQSVTVNPGDQVTLEFGNHQG